MDLNKNKILLRGINNNQKKNKEISLISPRNNQNNNTNKIGLVININNQKRGYNRLCNSNDNLKNKKYNNKRTLNEMTLNCLERENSLLKKEIEIVKSNLVISDKKEQINKKTIQEIKRMNKQKEISYKNMNDLIDEYKIKEINYLNKIKELEIQSHKKELELNNEIYSCKLELENKDKIINELNSKLEELKEKISNLKKIINEKNRILLFLTNKNNSKKFQRINSLNNILNARTMISSKSCGNIINKIFEFKNNVTENNSLIKIKRHHSKTGLKEILLNDEDYIKNENDNNKIKIIRKQSYYRKRIPKNIKQLNNESITHILKKYNSNKNINEHNSNNSLNNSLKNIEQNLNTNINLSSNRKRNKIILQSNNNIKEIFLNQRNYNLNELKNYSFILSDLEKHKNQIKTSKEIVKTTIDNKKLKPENMKVHYSTKNKLIEINKKFISHNNSNNNNPSFVSNFSFQNIFPSFPK